MSKTYIVDVEKNTTTVYPAPPASAGFATNPAGLMGRLSASPSALVYLSPGNELHYIGVDQNNVAASVVNPWALISSSELVAAAAADPVPSAPAASGTGSSTVSASGSMVTSRASTTGTASGAGASATKAANGAMGAGIGMGASAVVVALAGLQAWLMF